MYTSHTLSLIPWFTWPIPSITSYTTTNHKPLTIQKLLLKEGLTTTQQGIPFPTNKREQSTGVKDRVDHLRCCQMCRRLWKTKSNATRKQMYSHSTPPFVGYNLSLSTIFYFALQKVPGMDIPWQHILPNNKGQEQGKVA